MHRALFLLSCLLLLLGQVPVSADERAGGEGPAVIRLRRTILGGIRHDEALFKKLSALEAELEDRGHLAELWAFRAECLRRGGQFDQALAEYARARAATTGGVARQLGLDRSAAETVWLMGDLPRAEAAFRALSALSDRLIESLSARDATAPDAGHARFMRVVSLHHLAAVLQAQGRLTEAIETYEGLLATNQPENPLALSREFGNALALFNMAALHRRLAEEPRFRSNLERLAREFPAYRPLFVKSELYLSDAPAEGSETSVRALLELVRQHPSDEWAPAVRARIAYLKADINDRLGARAVLDELVHEPMPPEAAYGGLVRDAVIDAWKRRLRYAMHDQDYRLAQDLCTQLLVGLSDHPISDFVRGEILPELAQLRESGELDNAPPSSVVAPLSNSPPKQVSLILLLLAPLGALSLRLLTRRRGVPIHRAEWFAWAGSLPVIVLVVYALGHFDADGSLAPPAANAARESGSLIIVEDDVLDFGTRYDDEQVEVRVAAQNVGSRPVELLRIDTGCGCASGLLERRMLQPSERMEVPVRITLQGYVGDFVRRGAVVSSDPLRPRVGFQIHGHVRSRVELSPRMLHLAQSAPGLLAEGEVTLHRSDGGAMAIEPVRPLPAGVTAEVVTKQDTKVVVRVSVASGTSAFAAPLILRVDDREVAAQLNYSPYHELECLPGAARLGIVSLPFEFKLRLAAKDGAKYRVERVATGQPGLEASVSDGHLLLRLSDGIRPGVFSGEVRMTLGGLVAQRELVVPVSALVVKRGAPVMPNAK